MKSFISIACALLLLGCSNDSVPTVIAPVPVEAAPVAAAPVAAPAATPAAEITPPKPPSVSVDGAALYGQKCASCHGTKAEKAALNKSQIIANFSESQVKEALKGYQNGTYGKDMKALMQGQVKGLNDAQIDALAKHIATL